MADRNFLKLASEFLERYKDELDGAFGVVMVGSASVGVVDELGDIDLIVYAPEKMVIERKNSAKGYNEKYSQRGIDVYIDWAPIENIKKVLEDWKDDEAPWVLANAKIIHDPKGILKKTLERLNEYPPDLKERKLLLCHYLLMAFLDDCKKAIQRGMFLTAAFLIHKALEELSYLPFILETKFVSYPKWRFHEMLKTPLGRTILTEIGKIIA